MGAKRVTAFIIPHGKILDFVDGTLRNETPEEYVRQEIEKSLVREYLYSKGEIAVEFRLKVGSASRRVDLVVFPEGAAHKQETAWAIVECKSADVPPSHKKDGVEQLKFYLAACPNTQFGMWTNGQERACFQKVQGDTVEFVEITDIPVKGRDVDDIERPSRETLRPASSDALLFTFKRCHNYIAGNQGLQKPEAFWELLKLIFCKIHDERADDLSFYATTRERQSLNGQLKVKRRLGHIFHDVAARYATIFRANDEIELDPRVLAYIVAQLQGANLLDSEIDVKGKAYEEIVGSNLRGDRGEFFTPRNVCRMAVAMLAPGPDDLILDPACGTGGFLTIAMNHVIAKLEKRVRRRWRNRATPTTREQRDLWQAITEYANTKIVGIDINPNLVKAAKMNMVLNNDGSGGLYQGNSLEQSVTWRAELRDRDLLSRVRYLFTNPPFGSKIPVDDTSVLEQYDLAHKWDYGEDVDMWEIRDPRTLQKSQPPEILFIERCVQLLQPGKGRMAIVLPDGILGSPGLGYVREWILQQTRVLASIDLHPDTFQPKNSTQTSLLVLERKTFKEIELEKAARQKRDYNVFMALANHIGQDKRGNELYVRDDEGNERIEQRTKQVRETRDGVETVRRMTTLHKIRDDNTQDIAAAFREWLKTQ